MGRGLCGPVDPSVLYDQDSHVSTAIWNGKDRGKLFVRQSASKVGEWVLRKEQKKFLHKCGFGIFAHDDDGGRHVGMMRNDVALISALVERWRPECTSFHMPFGEITITLEDVYMLMGLPVYGIPLSFPELPDPRSYWLNQWVDPKLTEDPDDKMASYDGGISLKWLRNRYGVCRTRNLERQNIHTRAYLLYVIGGVLFPTKSNDIVHSRYVPLLEDPERIGCYAWGAAVLGYLFEQLSEASRAETKQISGCTMLLMLWAYERLLPGRPWRYPDTDFLLPRVHAWTYSSKIAKKDGTAHNRRPNPHHFVRSYRGMFDNFDLSWLTWEPYKRFYERDPGLWHARQAGLGLVPLIHWNVVEFQMPDRVMRQFGYRQHIPNPPVDMRELRQTGEGTFGSQDYSLLYARYIHMWNQFCEDQMGIVAEKSECCSIEDYMYWYRKITKLKINPEGTTDPEIQQPRDYYDNSEAYDVIQVAMDTFHRISLRGTMDAFYEEVPNFISAYNCFMEKHYPGFQRPEIRKPTQPEVEMKGGFKCIRP